METTPDNIKKNTQSSTHTITILSAHYFLYFGIMGIFLPYFNLLCHHLGLTGFQIGALNSTRTLVMVLFAIFWGALADRFALRRPIFIATSCLSAIAWGGYLLTDTFLPMMGVTVVYAIFFGPVIPFLETFTMEALSRKNTHRNDYGKIRAWGSVSFIGMVLAMGALMGATSTHLILPLIFIGSLMLGICTITIPKDLSPQRRSHASEIRGLFTPKALRFLVANFLMLASHGTYYGFFSIHLESLGYGPGFIGLAWSLATIAEMAIMMGSTRIFRYISIERALLLAALLATVRWVALFFLTSREAILLSQVLHAATYGLFHIACILYMERLSTPQNRTVGQVVNNAVSYGLGLMAGFLINGWLYDRYGVHLFLMSAAVSLVGALLIYKTGPSS